MSERATQELYAQTLRRGIDLWHECLPEVERFDPSIIDSPRGRMRFIGPEKKEIALRRPTPFSPVFVGDVLGRLVNQVRGKNVTRSTQIAFIETLETTDGYEERTLDLGHLYLPKKLNQPPYRATAFLGRAMLEGAEGQRAIRDICESVLQLTPKQLELPRGIQRA